jgi:ABC-type nickel/cobalt efflux system permease component RcnA
MPVQLFVSLALLISVAIGLVGRSSAIWLLVVAQALVVTVGAWMLRQKAARTRALDQEATRKSEALLERLSIATQAAGIYCWELDWNTYSLTWDASRLPPEEVADASRRHF